jgi:hypothetical protein
MIWRVLQMPTSQFAYLCGVLSHPLGVICFCRLQLVTFRSSLGQVEAEIAVSLRQLREADKLVKFVSFGAGPAESEAVTKNSLDIFRAAWRSVPDFPYSLHYCSRVESRRGPQSLCYVFQLDRGHR